MKRIIESPYTNGNAELMYEISKEIYRKEEFRVHKFYYKCKETSQRRNRTV